MSNPWDKAICPSCGWIGSSHSLGPNRSCPKCPDAPYEGVTTVHNMLHGITGANFTTSVFDDVNMPKFLGALQKLGLLKHEG